MSSRQSENAKKICELGVRIHSKARPLQVKRGDKIYDINDQFHSFNHFETFAVDFETIKNTNVPQILFIFFVFK